MPNLQEKLNIIRKQQEQVLAKYNYLLGAENTLLELIKESENAGIDESVLTDKSDD